MGETADPSGEDCLVCLQPTTERSDTLFLYNCTCLYAIHANCFRDWRRRSETSRICLICHEGLEDFDEEDAPLVRRPQRQQEQDGQIVMPPPPRAYADEWVYHREQQQKNMCLYGLFVFLTLVFVHFLLGLKSATVVNEPLPLRTLGSQNRLLL